MSDSAYGNRVMTPRCDPVHTHCMDDLSKLRTRLRRARDRRDAQPPYSPDWDAAMAEIEDVSRLVWRHVPIDHCDRAPATH